MVHPAVFRPQGRYPEWRLARPFLSDRATGGRRASDRRFPCGPGAGSVGLVDRETLKRQLDGDAHVFDTRTRAEFTGEEHAQPDPRRTSPGARHLSHTDLLGNGVVRPAPALRAMLERVGFGPGDHIVTHCEGGGRAALGAAAAVRAGFDDVRVYYLSFADWVRDESCPIVRD